MKIRPSYKQQGLMPLVIASVTAHTVLFALGSGGFKPAPEYAVITAQSSMEVVLLEEPKVKKTEKTLQEKVMTAPESPKEVVQEENEPVKEVEEKTAEKEEEVPEPVISAQDKGAVEESKPEYLRNPAPVYPSLARERGWEGLVKLNVFVDQAGNPAQIEIKLSSGYKLLDQAALKAVQRWKFKPASLGKMSFSAWIEVPVRFILER